MDQIIIDFPKTLLAWAALITGIVVAVSFVFYTWRNQSLKLLRESVEDMSKRIEWLETEVKRLCSEKTQLEEKYKEVQFKKNYLKRIVVEALASKKEVSRQLLEEISNHPSIKASGSR